LDLVVKFDRQSEGYRVLARGILRSRPRRGKGISANEAIRRSAVMYRVPCITTMSGAKAAAEAIISKHRDPVRVWSLQELHAAPVIAGAKM